MNILYASNICSDMEFKKIYDICNPKPLQSIQKFNKLLCEGLENIDEINIDIITSAPVNRKMCKKIFWKSKQEKVRKIQYNYCSMINLPIIKFISLFFSSMLQTLKWILRNKKQKKVVIYDAFCPIIANIAAFLGRIFGAKIIGMYTDLPMCMNDNLETKSLLKNKLKNIYRKVERSTSKLADGYILLTEQMNDVVNLSEKPNIIVEGVADGNIDINKHVKKYDRFTLLYAGGLYKKFGIEILVNAVKKIKDVTLILYGSGEMESELYEVTREYSNIEYRKTAPNDEVVIEEMKSTILVNPRFSNETYTKYSFPSKNMEYMASGTPLLTTRLKGMPKEYDKYVYFIDDETEQGIYNRIEELKQIDVKKLQNKGKDAQKFVLNEKNNVVQARKIYQFIQRIFD